MSLPPGQPDDDVIRRSEASAQKLLQLLKQREPAERDAVSPAIHATPPQQGLQEVVLHELAGPSGEAEWAVCFRGGGGSDGTVVPATPSGQRVAPHIVDNIIRQVPALSEAVRRREVFELIGPAGVIEKLRSGALELVPSKDGGVFGSLRIPQKNKIVQQARFRKIDLPAGVGLQLAFSVLTVAVGASYMQRIERQLTALNGKMDRMLDAQQASRHAPIASAMVLLGELNRQYVSAGHFTPNMRQRLFDLETELSKSYQELAMLHGRHRDRLRAMTGSSVEKLADAYASERTEILADARALIAAQTGLIEVDRLALLCEMEHEPELVTCREEKLRTAPVRVGELGERLRYLEEFNDESSKAIQRAYGQKVSYIWRGSTVEKVSARLHQDRLATSEILAELRRVASQEREPERPTVLVVDARADQIAAFALPAHTDEKA